MIKFIKKNTCAIVILYNPDEKNLILNLNALKKNFNHIILVDNSDKDRRLTKVLEDNKEIFYIKNLRNLGIAEAQNIGLCEAKKRGFLYICEFDQDTLVPNDFLETVISSYIYIKKYIDRDILCISPSTNFSNKKFPEKVLYTLSSGFFYPIEAIEILGYKEPEMFIDLVDWLWCMKANYLGKSIYKIPYIILNHNLGEGKLLIFGIPKPFRHYYAFRNYLYAIRIEYVPTSWKIKYLFINLFKLFFYPIIMPEGLLRLKFMLRGIKDGINGKMGKINE